MARGQVAPPSLPSPLRGEGKNDAPPGPPPGLPAEPPPFDSFGFDPRILQGVRDMGYLHPTPIQAAAMPILLGGHDLIGAAQTGSGKTAAFLLPIMQRLLPGARGKVRSLILEPTRELAMQVDEALDGLGYHTPLRGGCVIGGVDWDPQEKALRAGADVVVATPGRLLDHMKRGYVKFEGLDVLVLDEADRMLDMGFLPDIYRILRALPTERQTLLFSATMPPEIVRLSAEMMRNPKRIELQRVSKVPVGIRHAVYPVPQHRKLDLFLHLLRGTEMPSVLVFSRTKQGAGRLMHILERKGFKADMIHADRTQEQRIDALEAFRHGMVQILVATDIAARGIDIDDISHVINFDVPFDPDSYIHRIGRTGRKDLTGDAFTLVSPEEERGLSAIERALGHPLPRITLPDFDYRKPSTVQPGVTPRHGHRRHGRPHGGHGGGGGRPHGHGGHGHRGGGRRS
ncbi:MAG: DEAD/DEAH box helicase [Planctomycetes bacterium]|nr:DEAD/DEAH box helicase [Planctomycetota bacterium]